MSKSSKTKRSEERRKKKRARKDQNTAKYQAWAAAGTNKKSKRTRISAAKTRPAWPPRIRHRKGACGNIGCRKCSPLAKRLYEEKLASRAA